MPGYDIKVLNEDGTVAASNVLGSIVVKLPLPPGTLPTLWGSDDRFKKSYLLKFPGYYDTGDLQGLLMKMVLYR